MTPEQIALNLSLLTTEEPNLIALWLFGSAASGKTHPRSDLDFAALFQRRPDLLELGGLSSSISERLKRNDIDLVDLNSAPPFLRYRVLSGGILLLDPCPLQRVSFVARALSEYFDLAPSLRLANAH